MKKKIREIAEFGIITLVVMLIFMVILFIYFYIQVSYFPLESIYHELSIEEQIINEHMIF